MVFVSNTPARCITNLIKAWIIKTHSNLTTSKQPTKSSNYFKKLINPGGRKLTEKQHAMVCSTSR